MAGEPKSTSESPPTTQDEDGAIPVEASTSSNAVIVRNVTIVSVTIEGFLIFGIIRAKCACQFCTKNVRNEQQSGLTEEEIREFFEGGKNCQHVNETELGEGSGIVSNLNLTPYKNEYELDPGSFTIDEASPPLGSGEFGLVCRGNVKKDRGTTLEVAVKMVKESSSATALKGLLSEIKVMAYLGQHENLVGLVGAYTAELEKGKVCVFTELCGLGSLEKYLREHAPKHSPEQVVVQGAYANAEEICCVRVGESQALYANGSEVGQLGSNTLYGWSCQIASGMEFLASKQVVHADLATRNVLLTKDKTAKISDFGLSRRLYDYTNYVKRKQEPLPWRWMAPESLQRLEFNEKTDVWAFGVTLWEIYSFGNLPYPGLSWDVDFPTKLKNGLRLEEPEHNADGMYTRMLRCWSTDPSRRPTFSELRGSLQD